MKSLYDISWKVDEKTYRNDTALSHSTLAKFDKEGFYKLNTLFDKIETPSLTFGSAVDSLITGGQEEFNNKFIVCDNFLDEEIMNIVKGIYDNFSMNYDKFIAIPITQVSQLAKQLGFWTADKWSDDSRYKALLKKGDIERYYQLLRASKDKTVIDRNTYQDALKCVTALKTAESTRFYFADNELESGIVRYYQLKFKNNFNGVSYRSMLDLIIVDYNNKKIYPIDLKTSSTPEAEFYKSFIKYGYSDQARLYYRNLAETCSKDDYFKDFEIEDFTFVVVNRNTLTPLTWRYHDTKTFGDLVYGKDHNIICRDPFDIGEELNYYLTHPECKVPIGIKTNRTNDLSIYLEKM